MKPFVVLLLSLLTVDAKPSTNSEVGRPLDEDDFKRGESLTREFLMKQSKSFLLDDVFEIESHNAIKDTRRLWPSGRVPYTIDSGFDQDSRAVIARAIQRFKNTTCIRIEPKQASDTNYVHIQLIPEPGCGYSYVGMIGGNQTLKLTKYCSKSLDSIEHEFMHAIGFEHEHQRPDRDDWVRIEWDNVEENNKIWMRKMSWNEVQNLSESYDYGSVMHYYDGAFSKNGKPTIVMLKSGPKIGYAQDFSATDVRKIKKLYKCP